MLLYCLGSNNVISIIYVVAYLCLLDFLHLNIVSEGVSWRLFLMLLASVCYVCFILKMREVLQYSIKIKDKYWKNTRNFITLQKHIRPESS